MMADMKWVDMTVAVQTRDIIQFGVLLYYVNLVGGTAERRNEKWQI